MRVAKTVFAARWPLFCAVIWQRYRESAIYLSCTSYLRRVTEPRRSLNWRVKNRCLSVFKYLSMMTTIRRNPNLMSERLTFTGNKWKGCRLIGCRSPAAAAATGWPSQRFISCLRLKQEQVAQQCATSFVPSCSLLWPVSQSACSAAHTRNTM